ncbi:MAG: GyrI-like domain-containing protein [Planctomycetota bacterium]
MDKIDLKRQLKGLYKASAARGALVDVPPLNCLMIDGRGDPNDSPEFQDALQALYGASYTMKFASKKSGGPDWTVMGLEGLWWADDPADLAAGRKDRWQWTLLIVQPDVVEPDTVARTAAQLRRKKGLDAFERLRLERLAEGPSAQLLHVGPYSEEGASIERLHEFIRAEGYAPRGKHHEIYMSDARRVAPERLKTILRQPVGRP